MNNVRSEGGNPMRSSITTPGDEAYAPVCTFFACCVCRRTVSLDGQKMTSQKNLPVPSANRLSLSGLSSPSSTGGFLMSSQTTRYLDDEAKERRRRLRDDQMSVLRKLEEEFQQLEEQEPKTSSQGKADLEDDWEERETLRRQKLHPAIKGSLLTAAGKYAPLSPSPLSPWLKERYAVLRKNMSLVRSGEPQTVTSNKKRTTIAQDRMVTRLAPFFIYQYEWFAPEEPVVYMQELWRMFHNGPVPPPQPSSKLSAQQTEFRSEQPLPRATATPDASAMQMSATHRRASTQTASELPVPHADVLVSPLCPFTCVEPSSVASGEETFAFSPQLSVAAGHVLPPRISQITAQATANLPHSARILNMHKIKSMVPHAGGKYASMIPTAAQKAGTTSVASSLTTASSPGQPCVPTFSRETFLFEFSRHLMRLVVHKSRTNVPLCVRCWKDSLEAQQKETTRIMEDIIALSAVSASPDAKSFVLCFCPRRKRDVASDEPHFGITGGVGITDRNEKTSDRRQLSDSDNRYTNADTTENDVISQESLYRLQIEVWEVEANSRLMAKACQALHDELTVLSKQRTAVKLEWDEAIARYNARKVASFFDIEDAASGVSLRMQLAACSCTWMSKLHAMSLAFPIDTSGTVATIAGFRLGKCPTTAPSRRRSFAAQQRRAASAPPSKNIFAAEMSRSLESTMLMNQLHMQKEYARSLLGSRNDTVSIAEINQACGYLLRLLETIIGHHRISLSTFVLRPNGEQSTVEFVPARGSSMQITRRSSDFFISEKFFSWRTFGAACVIVASCVREIATWMKERLISLREAVYRRFIVEQGTMHSSWVSSATAVLESIESVDAPYDIVHDKVDGFPVRHGDVSENLWTLGMKKLLEVVQWCVMVSTNVDELQRLLEET
ncbi:hypothetical protein C3747_206g5 [Trypanosoma cruzi]|uniref:Atg6 BARA domain-containing protein n=2 Tax=Trypanosoma cruzi TaxID=5693 RepID=Q4D9W3_TRYCC|nr:hypothetical protein, conserved [Trypanosoma cruzi]EAN89320.1 hypothetical protein, conserved [Trypanosoma cruzi]PWV00461.1 hypothetical protein C3747_206g5 [Trypanosoma cruzi]RNC46538.1 hypothetical protein TcCL_NonESM03615 [Trypanosoma cruzi]|eukprot:XP_811171.1 hypothetical protein [Trypanosoma cruzi strain CL Brener]